MNETCLGCIDNMAMNEPAEPVDHPSYYNRGKYEQIDVIEDWNLGFCLGNQIKYICRAGFKDDDLQDLEKAAWYINREIEQRRRFK